jgi:hypothetical protein
MSPIQVLNAILNGDFNAPMAMNTFLVQVLLPTHKKLQIDALMNTLKESSTWISTNKKLSAEKPISKRLADELTTIMESSTPLQRNKYQPIPEEQFKYQSDVEKNRFEKLCSKQGEQYYVQYPGLLASDDYTNYIKDPFNKDKTSNYLRVTSPHYKVSGTKGECSFSPYGITYKSLTYDVGMLDRQVQLIDVQHYNAYLLVPRLVYHLSTKLKNNVIHNRIGQAEEVKLIHFLTRYRYATRAAPFCKLHGACVKYTHIQNVNYTNNCDNWNRMIPVTVFLVMLFNACFMYQPKVDTNLLITALNGFDCGMSLTNDTFMSTLSKLFH